MMINGAGRMRAPDWTHEETLLLAKLRRDAVFSRTIEGVWTRIGNNILDNFGHTRSDDQCKRRWETLQKVYKVIQRYCADRGREHWQLQIEDWESMKLATAYSETWYAVVKEVCEEEQNRKARKRRRQYPEPPRPTRMDDGDHTAIVPSPNAQDNPQSSGTVTQSSTSLMPSPQIENLPPSQAKIERLQKKIQTLRRQLQLAEQELQQITTHGDQYILGNSSSPGTSQSSQVVEQEEPQIAGASAPQQVNLKCNIVAPNPPGGDGSSSSSMDLSTLEDVLNVKLPAINDADSWAVRFFRFMTQFVAWPHSNSGPSDITDLSGVRGALRFNNHHSVVGSSRMPPARWPYTDEQGREYTFTIDTQITIKATQNAVPNSCQEAKKVDPDQERPPSIKLRLSTETIMQEPADEHQKLHAEFQRLQQQLQNVIQQISQVKPIGSPGSELLALDVAPDQSCLGEKDTAPVVTKDRIEPNNTSGIDQNCAPSLARNEVPGGNEPGYYMVVADDIEEATDNGLTEQMAQMSLSTTPQKSDLTRSKKKRDSPKPKTKTTTATPTSIATAGSEEDSLMIIDDDGYPQGSLCLTMDQSWLASAPPSSVCDELLGRSVTNMSIYKSSINFQPHKLHNKGNLMPSRRWRMLELLMRTLLHFKRSAEPLSSLEQNHLTADGNLGHNLRQTQTTKHGGNLWECTDCNY